jgi:Uncharacterized protein conserved in bacteria (DUF2219)
MNAVCRRAAALFLLPALLSAHPIPAGADPSRPLGVARLFVNDALGDGQDRWRTGSYSLGILHGSGNADRLPDGPFVLQELRLHSEIMAPADLVSPDPGDRRYAGIISLGLATHFARGPAEFALGGGLTAVGPSTGLAAFHRLAHDAFGLPDPAAAATQIGDRILPFAEAEAGRPIRLAQGLQVRPFLSARAGDETFLRLGADLTIGASALGGIHLREGVTGFRMATTSTASSPGAAIQIGADAARVFGSEFLPGGTGGAAPAQTRTRLRAGITYGNGQSGFFYGLTWLGREFAGQPQGQLTGAMRVDFRF